MDAHEAVNVDVERPRELMEEGSPQLRSHNADCGTHSPRAQHDIRDAPDFVHHNHFDTGRPTLG